MLYRNHTFAAVSGWTREEPFPVILNFFLFDPSRDDNAQLKRLEQRFPRIKAVYRKSRLVLLCTAEVPERFLWKMVEIGPRGLSSVSDMIPLGAPPLETDALFLGYTHEREDAIRMLSGIRRMSSFRGGSHSLQLEGRVHPKAHARLAEDGAEMVEQFRRRLDPDILKVMDEVDGVQEQRVYNWIALSKERRLQAVADYPRIAPLFMEIERSSGHELSALLDLAGGSLEEFLCEQLRIRKVTFRHINRLPEHVFNDLKIASELSSQLESVMSRSRIKYASYAERPLSMVAILDALPAHMFPSEVEDWEMLAKISKDLFSLAKHGRVDITGTAAALGGYLSEVAQNYARYAAARTTTGQTLWQEDVYHVRDAMTSLVEMVIMPGVAATGMVRKNLYPARRKVANFDRLLGMVTEVFTKNGMKDIYSFSRLWHEREVSNRVTTGTPQKDKEDLLLPWALEEPWTSPEGYRFEPLRHYRDVQEEGRRMQHCLASYADSCLAGSYLAFRIYGPGSFRATATIAPGKTAGSYTFHEIQFFKDGWLYNGDGKRLKRVAAPRDVAMQLVGYLNREKPEIRTCEESRRYLATRGNWHTAILTEPDIAREIAEANFAIFQPLLPKRLRAATVDDLLEGPFLDAVLPIMKKSWSSRLLASGDALFATAA